MEFLTYLRVLRLRHGIELQELGRKVNISNQLVSRIELLQVPPTPHHERMMAAALRGVLQDRMEGVFKLEQDIADYSGRYLEIMGGEIDEP